MAGIRGVRARAATVLFAALAVVAPTGVAVTVGAGVADAAGCADVHIVAARGTNEPGGWFSKYKLGIVVGNPVYRAIRDGYSGSVDAYRVQYPASTNQPRSIKKGNQDMVEHVIAQAAECPEQSIVLVGYSQGANVVDNSIGISSEGAKVGGPIVATLPDELEPRINAILLFGNPIRELGKSVTGPYADRTFDVCHDNDPVCDPDGSNWNVHTNYQKDAAAAAEFALPRL